jgi:hypothetical protein
MQVAFGLSAFFVLIRSSFIAAIRKFVPTAQSIAGFEERHSDYYE